METGEDAAALRDLKDAAADDLGPLNVISPDVISLSSALSNPAAPTP